MRRTARSGGKAPRSNFTTPDRPTLGAVFQVHPLRAVPAAVPDLPRAGARSRFAARAHLPGAAGGRGAAGDRRLVCHPHRPLPGLPRLRDGVPVGRAVRPDPGAGAGGDRDKLPAPVAGTAAARIGSSPACCTTARTWSAGRGGCGRISGRDCRRWRAPAACSSCWDWRKWKRWRRSVDSEFFFSQHRHDASRRGRNARPGAVSRGMHRQRRVFQVERSHGPGAEQERLRRFHPARPALLRGAAGARRISRGGAEDGRGETSAPCWSRRRTPSSPTPPDAAP